MICAVMLVASNALPVEVVVLMDRECWVGFHKFSDLVLDRAHLMHTRPEVPGAKTDLDKLLLLYEDSVGSITYDVFTERRVSIVKR